MNKLGLKIIDRYIIRKFLGTYFFAIMMIIVIIVVFDMTEKMPDFTQFHAPFSSIVVYYLNFVPSFISQFSGLFTFIAVIFFTSKMAYQTEVIAILSSGVSFKRFLWPYFLSSMVIMLLSLLLNLFVIPKTQENVVDFESKYLKKGQRQQFEKDIHRQIEKGTFVYLRNYRNLTNEDYQYGSPQRANHTADFFTLETYESGKIITSLSAGNVSFDPKNKRWTAPMYTERKFVDGKEYFEKKKDLDTLINLDVTEIGGRVERLVQTMNIIELNRFVKQQKLKGSDMVDVFRVEQHNRFVYPMATFILTLIGVSLSSRKVRGGTGLHIGIGIALCFTYILLMKFASEFAKTGDLPVIVTMWFTNILFLFVGIYLYRKAPK